MSRVLENEYSINIDSSLRNKKLYPNSNKFSINLESKLKYVSSIRLASIEIPNVDYVISCEKLNNYFYIDRQCINIHDGNYSPEELIEHVNHELDHLGLGVHLYLDTTAAKVFFQGARDFCLDFSNTKFGSILGFTKQRYSYKCKYRAEQLLNVLGNNYIFVKINDYGIIWHNGVQQNFLAKVILDQDKNYMVFDSNHNLARTHIFNQPITLNQFEVELRDKYNKLIDLHNMDYSITLAYTINNPVNNIIDEPIYGQSIPDNKYCAKQSTESTIQEQETVENNWKLTFRHKFYIITTFVLLFVFRKNIITIIMPTQPTRPRFIN